MSIYSSSSAEYSAVIKGAPGLLRWAYFTPGSSGGAYLMLFDATAVPADGAVTPLIVIGQNVSVFPRIQNEGPAFFVSGIVLAVSSTGPFTKTTLTGPAGFFRAEYE